MLEDLSDRQLDLLIRFHIGKPSFRREIPEPPVKVGMKQEDPFIRGARLIARKLANRWRT